MAEHRQLQPPKSLRLAQHLENFRSFPGDLAAAAELRRLQAANDKLKDALQESQSLLAAMLHEQRPQDEIEDHLRDNRAALEFAQTDQQ